MNVVIVIMVAIVTLLKFGCCDRGDRCECKQLLTIMNVMAIGIVGTGPCNRVTIGRCDRLSCEHQKFKLLVA